MNEFVQYKNSKIIQNVSYCGKFIKKKCFFLLVLAVIKRRNVQFWHLAEELNTEAKTFSNLLCIQRFFSGSPCKSLIELSCCAKIAALLGSYRVRFWQDADQYFSLKRLFSRLRFALVF